MLKLLKLSPLMLALAALLALNTTTQAEDGKDEVSLENANLGTHVHGPEIDAEALEGKVVVFEYWGDRCPPCVRAIPHLNEVQAEYGRDKLIIVANQVWTKDVDQAKEAWTKHGGKDEVTVVNHGALENAKVRGVPHAFIFDHEGKLVWKGHPASPKFDEHVKKAVEAMPDEQTN